MVDDIRALRNDIQSYGLMIYTLRVMIYNLTVDEFIKIRQSGGHASEAKENCFV